MFKNLGNLGQMAGLLKNFGQIKTKISQKKEELATQVVNGEVTGGSVKNRNERFRPSFESHNRSNGVDTRIADATGRFDPRSGQHRDRER